MEQQISKSPLTLGKIYFSFNVDLKTKNFEEFNQFVTDCLKRHQSNDWGDLEEEDLQANNEALLNFDRILSAYKIPNHIKVSSQDKIWIITEWDRIATTVLFPNEY